MRDIPSKFYNLPSEFFGEKISNVINDKILGKYAEINANSIDRLPLLSATAIPDEGQTFYGVLANFLIIPALIYALIKGNNKIKFITIIMLLFFIALSFSMKWDPWRSRFMALFFVGSSLSFAFFISQYIYNKNIIRNIFFVILLVNLCYTLFFNVRLPAPGVNQTIRFVLNKFNINRVWDKDKSWIECIFDRSYNYNYYYGKRAIEIYKDSIPNNSKILFIAGEMIFPFMLQKPTCYHKVMSKVNIEGKQKYGIGETIKDININDYDYILYQFNDKLELNNIQLIAKTQGYQKGLSLYKIIKN